MYNDLLSQNLSTLRVCESLHPNLESSWFKFQGSFSRICFDQTVIAAIMPGCNDGRHEGATHGDAITFIVVPSRSDEESQDPAAADDCDDGYHTTSDSEVRWCDDAVWHDPSINVFSG